MYIDPFRQPGRFYQGNLHTHTTLSDGVKTAEEVIASYRTAGYDFVAITDHFLERYRFPITDTRSWRGPHFTTLLGAELHAGQTGLGEPWHLLAVGLPLDFAPTQREETGAQLSARAVAAGAFVAAAHPCWYGVTPDDIVALGPIDAVETYNANCQADTDRGDSWQTLDTLLAQGRRYLGCATDDAHFRPECPDWQRAWVAVKAAQLDPQALLDALHSGSFYSSTGPAIHDLRLLSGNRLTVACSPCQAVYVVSRGAWGRHVHGKAMTEATFALDGLTDAYLRVIVHDAADGRAWSNPLWL